MGYIEVVKKCAEVLAAETNHVRQRESIQEMRKELPRFCLPLKNGDVLVVEVLHRGLMGSDEFPLVHFNEAYKLMTPNEVVAVARWILDVFDGMPTDKQ